MTRRRLLHIFLSAGVLFAVYALAAPGVSSAAGPFSISPGQEIIGENRVAYALEKDTLLDIARDYDVGYNAITAANPDIDPWLPVPRQKVFIPSSWILPSAKREGIVLNLAEMRLYYFYYYNNSELVMTFPIGVGREGFDTPLGEHWVVGKEKDPIWHPTASSRLERPELPEAVPPGPDNPLGGYKVSLNIPGYLLHGTNKPYGVGRRVSHGCIRLYPEDIVRLFFRVSNGTPVEVVYQPVKAAYSDGRFMVEVHDDYLHGGDLMEMALDEIGRLSFDGIIDGDALKKAVTEKRGVPVDVTYTAPPVADTPAAR